MNKMLSREGCESDHQAEWMAFRRHRAERGSRVKETEVPQMRREMKCGV